MIFRQAVSSNIKALRLLSVQLSQVDESCLAVDFLPSTRTTALVFEEN